MFSVLLKARAMCAALTVQGMLPALQTVSMFYIVAATQGGEGEEVAKYQLNSAIVILAACNSHFLPQ